MKILFDSSAFIAGTVESHPKHKSALSWLMRAKTKQFELVVSAHTILEVYSVLTRAPFEPKITPDIATKMIEANINNIAVIQSLDAKEYVELIQFISSLKLEGGIVYDALIYKCAKKANVKKIVTSNTKDFNKINRDLSIEIISL